MAVAEDPAPAERVAPWGSAPLRHAEHLAGEVAQALTVVLVARVSGHRVQLLVGAEADRPAVVVPRGGDSRKQALLQRSVPLPKPDDPVVERRLVRVVDVD